MNVEEKSYVKWVYKNYITVVLSDKKLKKTLLALGGKRQLLSGCRWKIPFSSEKELGRLFSELRDHDICFAGRSAGWPPAAVFEHLRDKGLISGNFNEIIWRDRNSFEIWSK